MTSMRRERAGRRGMTLVELMVTLGILGIVMAGTSQTLVGFQAIYATSMLQRQASANARMGLGFLERDLRSAGMAVDPGLAFDFTVYKGFAQDADPTDGVVVAPGHSFDCSGAGSPTSECLGFRDRTDGPDELVFYARNPHYWGADLNGPPEGRAWYVASADTSSVTINAHGGEYIGKGQILQLVCTAGSRVAFVRASQTRDNRTGGPGALSISLDPAVADDPYSQPGDLTPNTCLGGGERAFAVDRFRYHIRELELAPGLIEPFLALDTGVDQDGDGTIDYKDIIPIAAGIVDMQVAYVRPEDAPSVFNRVGATPGLGLFSGTVCTAGTATNWTIAKESMASCLGSLRLLDFSTIGPSRYKEFGYVTAGGSFPSVAAPSDPRRGPDAANITEVEVHLVGRSLTEARERAPAAPPVFLNRDVPSPASKYVYSSVELTVPVPNLTSGSNSYL